MTTCIVRPQTGGNECGESASATGTTGCRHEHIRSGPICDKHAEMWRHHDGHNICGQCKDLDGHLCYVTIRIKEFA